MKIGPTLAPDVRMRVEAHMAAKTAESEQYRGPERRRYRLFVTRNTEYHCRDNVCVAVRDRRSDVWVRAHLALHRRVTGGVKVLPNGTAIPSCDDPRVGEALYFGEDGRELITSVLCGVERPSPAVVRAYSELAAD